MAIFCNKQDSPDKLDKGKIRDLLEIDYLYKRPGMKYSIRSGSGNECTGISDALDWLSKNLRKRRKKIEAED